MRRPFAKTCRRRSAPAPRVALALLFVCAGCYTHRVVVSGVHAAEEPAYDRWRHHFLGGLIDPNDEIGLREVCPAGVATVEHEHAPLNVLVAIVTAMIYTPTTARVYCQRDDEPAEARVTGNHSEPSSGEHPNPE